MDEIFDLIKKLEDEGNYEEALGHLEIAFEEKLGDFDIRSDMGRVYNKMRRFDQALSCFDIVLTMDDSNSEYLFGKGISLIGLNNFGEALEVFDKITNIDKTNANAWYYKSILSKLLGDFNADKYFKTFLKYDNSDFRFTRSFYKFGLLFDETEHKFRRVDRLDRLEVLSEFKAELNSLNLDDNQYSEIVRLVPLEDLFDKTLELKKNKFTLDTIDIIRNEFKKEGLVDDEIDDLFEIDTIDNLKNEVIELSGTNPFPDEEDYSKLVPLKTASRYNVIKPRLLKKYEDLRLFNMGNFYLDYNDNEKAIECYDEGLKFNPDNLMLKFVKCCAIYKLGDDDNV